MKMKSIIIVLFTFGALFAIDAPENLQAVGGDGQIDLNWNAVDGAASYNVYQVVEDGGGTGGEGCEFDWTAYGAADCDAAWVEFGIDCATLEATYGWDCAGCECPGDGTGTGDGTTESCDDCEFDWSDYGSECCDTAFVEFGIDCATLEATYGWDCTGCACPGDVPCEDQGLITCSNGSCAASEADCPEMLVDCSGTEFSEEYLAWIGDGYCDSADGSWNPDLDFNCEEYDFDGGDCDGRSIAHNGSKILSIAVVDAPVALPGTVLNDGTTFTASNTNTREVYVYLGSVEGTEATITGFSDGDEGCFVVTADDGETGGVGDSCGNGVMLDCWLQCVDEVTLLSWIGDGWCDDNTYGMYLDCPEFDCDGGDCPELNCDGGGGAPLSCEEQGLVTCADGSCAASEADCPASSADCEACEFDWTAYGAECCDAAWAGFGVDCATLEGTYGWDCTGCACPGDVACEDQGLITCSDGSCAASEADCPEMLVDCSGTEFTEEYLAWIGDGYCDSADGSWTPDLDFNCEEYDFDGGDCDGRAITHNGVKIISISRYLEINGKEFAVSVEPTNTSSRAESAYSNEACATASSCATGGTGDVNADGATNVLDIVQIVNYILGSVEFDDCQFASADLNGDSAANVLDIVAIVNLILDGRSADASSARLIDEAGVVSIDANGYVGAVQMTLTHGADFSISLTDKAMVADFATNGNTTTLVVVAPESDQIFTSNGEFEITEMIVANSSSEINVVMATEFSLMAAYPNPFNPSTTLSLNVPENGFVSVKVFNLMGQVVATLAEGNMDANTYSFTWNASDMPSGMYMVRAETLGQVSSQKLMLLK